ncbi:MAG: hypothetical protein IJ375_03340, partial [Oscillospiraceae bacterium]|nr:hypothetical protein [Oscillospiraceae bacterium]
RMGTTVFPRSIKTLGHPAQVRRHGRLPRQCEHWLAMTAYFLDAATTVQRSDKLQFEFPPTETLIPGSWEPGIFAVLERYLLLSKRK